MKVKVQIQLNPEEILYDIKNRTYLKARTGMEGDNYAAASDSVADGGSETDNQLARSMSNAMAQLRARLSEYEGGDATAADDVLAGPQQENITLQVPANFNTAVTDQIATWAHMFVVNQTLADWYSLTSSDNCEYYTTLAAANLDSIEGLVYKRKRPERQQ